MYVRSIISLLMCLYATGVVAVTYNTQYAIFLPGLAIVLLLPMFLAEQDIKKYAKAGLPIFVLSYLALLVLACMGSMAIRLKQFAG